MTKFKVMSDLVQGKNLISHLFMNEIHKTKWFKNTLKRREGMTDKEIENETVDIKLTVAGEEIPFEETFNFIELQLEDMIKRNATELVKEQTSEKFTDVSNKMFEMQQVVEEWANDINWDYDYKASNFKKDKSASVEEAKQTLTDDGYYIGSLWHLEDVKTKFECTDDEAFDILSQCVDNEWIIEQINVSIDDAGEYEGLTRKEEE